jgi:MarR family transcriptional regulator, lower aerobic nicotinate degradation pathway regulator
MPTIAKSSRKPQLLKSKPVKHSSAQKPGVSDASTVKSAKSAPARATENKTATKVAVSKVVPKSGAKKTEPRPVEKISSDRGGLDKAAEKGLEKSPDKSQDKSPDKGADAQANKVMDKSIAVPKASVDRTSAFKAAAVKAAAAKASAANPTGATGNDNDYVLEDQIGFHLRRAHQRATGIFHDIMAPFDVTPTQFAALAKIDELGAVSQTFLGRLTGMDAATILGVVGRLLRQGLIVARAEPGDMRMTVLELSPKGRLSIDTMKATALSVSAKTLEPLSPAEAKTLSQLLAKIM